MRRTLQLAAGPVLAVAAPGVAAGWFAHAKLSSTEQAVLVGVLFVVLAGLYVRVLQWREVLPVVALYATALTLAAWAVRSRLK